MEAGGIAQAERLAAAMGLTETARFQVADCSRRLPFDDASFDAVICFDAVNHLGERFAVLAEWFRLLRPGGKLLFTDAAVLTGAISKAEIDIRGSHGQFMIVPPGLNEAATVGVGFALRLCANKSDATASIALASSHGTSRQGRCAHTAGRRRLLRTTSALPCDNCRFGIKRAPVAFPLHRRQAERPTARQERGSKARRYSKRPGTPPS
jgi:SAM-dependent methyltransferase